MNTFNICLIAVALVGLVTGAEESHELPLKNGRTTTTIWDEFNEQLRNATRGTRQYMKYGVKAAVETLKSTVQNEIDILYRLNNIEAVAVRSALLNVSNLLGKVEDNISAMDTFLACERNILNETDINGSYSLSTAKSTDGLEDLMERIQLLGELLDTLGKIMVIIMPPPTSTTSVTTEPTTNPPASSTTPYRSTATTPYRSNTATTYRPNTTTN